MRSDIPSKERIIHWIIRILCSFIFLFSLSCSGTPSTHDVEGPPSTHDPLLNQMLHEREKTQQVVNDFALLQKDRYLAGEITKEEMRTLIDAKYQLEKEKLSETLRILEEEAQQ